MKTVFKYFAISAIAILAAACNKEQTESVPQNENGFVYTFGFANGDADLLGTRATFASDEDGMYVDFEEGDYINSYAYSTTEEKYSYNKQGAINYNQNPVTFQVISHYALVVGDEVYCHFPYSNSGNTPKTANLSIKSAQTQSGNKYDASAAPMVSAPFQVKEAFNAKEEKTVGEIKFYNLASVIELDIFSPNGAYSSESITGVSFVANDAICGNFSFDLTAVDTDDLSTLGITGLSGTTVNLTVSDALNVGSATNKDNAVKAYLVVAPGTHSGTLTVTTSVAQYTYTIPSRVFNRAEIRKFGINLEKEGARQVIRDVEYTLVESATNIQAGANYLVVSRMSSPSSYWAMSTFNGGNFYESCEVTPSSNKISVSSDKIVSITLEDAGDGYFYLKDSDDKYIKAINDNKLERAASYEGDAFKWAVASNSIKNKGLSTRQIRFNASATPKRFAAYTGTQNAITLYVDASTLKTKLATPVVSGTSEGTSLTASWDAVENAGSYVVTLSNGATDTVTGTSKTFTSLEAGMYTVSVVAIPSDANHFLDSDAGVSSEIKVGAPALAKPTITAFAQTSSGFSATIVKGDDYTTSYSWILYEGQINDNSVVGMGNTTALEFTAVLASDDFDITEFTVGTTYFLVVTAEADGFTSTASDPASFVAKLNTAKQYTLTINPSNFGKLTTGSGYATYNGDHTFTVKSNDNTSTMEVVVNSYQIMVQNSNIQFQKSNGVLYNKTDLGKIISITAISGVTQIIGSTVQPTASSTDGGYFKLSAGSSSTPTTSQIVIVFEK